VISWFQSLFFSNCSLYRYTSVPRVHATVSENYFRFFCEKFAGSVAPKVYGAVFRCKRFSDTGAQQLLLDVHAVKTLLIDLPTYTAAREAAAAGGASSTPAVPASYARLVTREMGKCEALLKVVLVGTYPKWHAQMLAKVPKIPPKYPKITRSDAGESPKCR
jgi:hypothetical protein